MKTIGQAVDAAIEQAAQTYPGAEVYGVRCIESAVCGSAYRVELDAVHFSQPLVYYIPKA